MAIYWFEFTVILLKGLLFMLISALPCAFGISVALFHLRKKRKASYCREVWASSAAGAVTLLLLSGSIFGDDLSSSSTAVLIFLFAPIYSAGGLCVGYLIGAVFNRFHSRDSEKAMEYPPIPGRLRILIWIPVLMLAVFVFGVIRFELDGNDVSVANHASYPDTLRYAYERVADGESDAFGVPLFLAQNDNTPSDVLSKLSESEHPQVRAFVASNPNTPDSIVTSLGEDGVDCVRESALKRLHGSAQP